MEHERRPGWSEGGEILSGVGARRWACAAATEETEGGRMRSNTTWRKEILEAMDCNGETWADVVDFAVSGACTDAEFDREFSCGYGGREGVPFAVWTSKRVYFPVVYDGSEWCGSASRNPDGIAMTHQGGE